MNSPQKTLRAREIVSLALLGALLTVCKLAMNWPFLSNIEPVSAMILAYTAALGRRAFYPVAVFVALECLLWGVGLWSVNYLYIWPLLVLIGLLLRRTESPVVWAAAAGSFGLFFGALCAPVYLFTGGWAFALSWWAAGIPYDLLHCGGNFALTLLLFHPLRRLLERYVVA